MDAVDLVRDFNRYYTRRLGVLTDRYLGQDRPLSEARLLFEIGDRADLRDLRSRLGLDSGYLSRLLRSLSGQGLVEVRPHPDDRRVRVATLTATGVRERADLDDRSRDDVAVLLERLTPAQRDRLIAAQRQVRQLFRLAGVAIEAVPDDTAAARSCLRAYAGELSIRFPEGYDESALLSPGELAAGGAFLLATEEERPVGCGVWQRLGESEAEIRHLWVGGEARGIGLGRRLLAALEIDAAGHGIKTLRLGTHPVLTEAIELYRSNGYRAIPVYGDSPYNQLAFAKTLL
jgi:DNA-binding MarR family transcriptional regulator/GNAT superfamily N-acetyltransferase